MLYPLNPKVTDQSLDNSDLIWNISDVRLYIEMIINTNR